MIPKRLAEGSSNGGQRMQAAAVKAVDAYLHIQRSALKLYNELTELAALEAPSPPILKLAEPS